MSSYSRTFDESHDGFVYEWSSGLLKRIFTACFLTKGEKIKESSEFLWIKAGGIGGGRPMRIIALASAGDTIGKRRLLAGGIRRRRAVLGV